VRFVYEKGKGKKKTAPLLLDFVKRNEENSSEDNVRSSGERKRKSRREKITWVFSIFAKRRKGIEMRRDGKKRVRPSNSDELRGKKGGKE